MDNNYLKKLYNALRADLTPEIHTEFEIKPSTFSHFFNIKTSIKKGSLPEKLINHVTTKEHDSIILEILRAFKDCFGSYRYKFDIYTNCRFKVKTASFKDLEHTFEITLSLKLTKKEYAALLLVDSKVEFFLMRLPKKIKKELKHKFTHLYSHHEALSILETFDISKVNNHFPLTDEYYNFIDYTLTDKEQETMLPGRVYLKPCPEKHSHDYQIIFYGKLLVRAFKNKHELKDILDEILRYNIDMGSIFVDFKSLLEGGYGIRSKDKEKEAERQQKKLSNAYFRKAKKELFEDKIVCSFSLLKDPVFEAFTFAQLDHKDVPFLDVTPTLNTEPVDEAHMRMARIKLYQKLRKKKKIASITKIAEHDFLTLTLQSILSSLHFAKSEVHSKQEEKKLEEQLKARFSEEIDKIKKAFSIPLWATDHEDSPIPEELKF